MRRRRRHRGTRFLLLSFLLSALIHLVAYVPVKRLTEAYLTSTVRTKRPVKVVQLSRSAWSENLQRAKEARKRQPTKSSEAKKDTVKAEVEPPKKEKKEEKKPDKLQGQVVEVPPTADDSPNPEAKFLSKYNSHVKKESTARMEDRDRSKSRVTNKLQDKQATPSRQQAFKNPVLDVKGDGQVDKAGQKKPGAQGDQKFVLEMPDLKQRDEVQLKLSEAPGRRSMINNRLDSEEMKGNSNRFKLKMGKGQDEEAGDAAGKKGSDNPDALPSLAALRPTIGTVARISGSPSNDYVENVPEGEGTFLNAKEFKYATFFYRVKNSVAGRWENLAASQYRRRDPTGNIYGFKDRATLLHIEIALDGSLDKVRIAQTSGVDFLDQAAVQAFEMAQPFPNPPSAMADDDGLIRFNFQFVVVMSSRSPLNLFR